MSILNKLLCVAAVGTCVCAGCSDDIDLPSNLPADDHIYFTVQVAADAEVEVMSRTIPADDVEKEIHSLRILIFDKNGNLIPEALFEKYDKSFNSMVLEYSATTYHDDHRGFSVPVMPASDSYNGMTYDFTSCQIWAFANLGRWEHAHIGPREGEGTTDDVFEGVSTLADLEALYGKRDGFSMDVTRSYLPMVGTYYTGSNYPAIDAAAGGSSSHGVTFDPPTSVDLTQRTPIGNAYIIYLNQLVAKIQFDITVDNGYEFYFNTWTVRSIPRYTEIVPSLKDFDEYVTGYYPDAKYDHGSGDPVSLTSPRFYPSTFEEYNKITDEANQTIHPGLGSSSDTWISNNDASELTRRATSSGTYQFYMYGNRRGNRTTEPNTNNLYEPQTGLTYPTDPTGVDPRYKTLYAPDKASFLVITGLVRKPGETQVDSFVYSIALGANNYNDYNIRRNHAYIYHITIGGLTHNDVNVEVEANFNSSAHRRYAFELTTAANEMIDCHYDKRYFDILAAPGTMEMQLYSDAECTQPVTADNSWLRVEEITNGGEKYDFTSANQTVGLSGLTYTDTDTKNFCVYADEYLNPNGGTRDLYLQITHYANEGVSQIVSPATGALTDKVSRTIKFTQYPPIVVQLSDTKTIWVEQFEEYAFSLDPARDDDLSSTGLMFGWYASSEADTQYYEDWHDFSSVDSESDGSVGTLAVVNTACESHQAVPDYPRYQDYAARYCYHKNARQAADGSVLTDDYHWYLPAIDEMNSLTGTFANSWGYADNLPYMSSTVPTSTEVRNLSSGFLGLLDQIVKALASSIHGVNPSDYRNQVKWSRSGSTSQETEKVTYTTIFGTENTVNFLSFGWRLNKVHVRAIRLAPSN